MLCRLTRHAASLDGSHVGTVTSLSCPPLAPVSVEPPRCLLALVASGTGCVRAVWP
jgi:hypothetical protein